MKRPKLIVSFLIISAFFFTFCDKRPFATIEIHGRILRIGTNAPLPANIDLWTGGSPGEKGTHYLVSTTTSDDGTFDVKSKAGWNSNSYALLITVNTGSISIGETRFFDVGKNQVLDAGDIIVGP